MASISEYTSPIFKNKPILESQKEALSNKSLNVTLRQYSAFSDLTEIMVWYRDLFGSKNLYFH